MAGPDQNRFDRIDALQLAVIVLASIAAVAGFKAVFTDWGFIISAAIGAIGAGAVVALSWQRRLLVGETLAVSVIALVVLGAIATSGLPTPSAFSTLFDGLRSGWADLLSLTPPLDDTAELRALPFALAWIGATIGGELLHRTQQPTLPAVGPLIALAVSVLVTAENRSIALTQGIVIAVGALVIGRAQLVNRGADTIPRRPGVDDSSSGIEQTPTPKRRSAMRLLRAGVACVAVGIAAPLIAPRLPLADAYDRFDLRDRQVPPWDPLSAPSPLVQLKAALKDDIADDVMFTVTSNTPITRFDLAVLGDYDGVVWTVGSALGRDAATEFRPVSSDLANPPVDLEVESQQVSATITINNLDGPWLPTAGWTDELKFAPPVDGEPDQLLPQDELRMNLSTGTLALPRGIGAGLTYELDLDIDASPTESELSVIEVAELPVEQELDVIPPPIRNLAADILEGTDVGWSRAAAIRDAFVTDGFYDVSPVSRPGHSYFRLAEFLLDPDQLIGYEEQYAAAAATIAGIAGLPTRVVVGYVVPENRYTNGTAEIVSSDISAWIEVDFGVSGWVAVDVTPDRSREPTADATGSAVEDVAVASPPPPPQIPPTPEVFAEDDEEEEEDEEEEDEEEDEEDVASGPGRSVLTTAALATAALGLFALIAVTAIVIWKVLRRRRRRQTDDAALSVALAWRETLDRCAEAGLEMPDRVTPPEAARLMLSQTSPDHSTVVDLRGLASVVQRSAYHADPPASPDAARAWQYYDDVVEVVHNQHSSISRLKMAADPRTLNSRGWANRSEQGPTT